MADIKNMFKSFMKQSAKLISRTTSNAVSATRYKMDEMGNSGRRRDKIAELGEKVYELSQAGVALPVELNDLLGELKELEKELEVIKSDRAAAKVASAERAAADKAERAAEKAAAKAAAAAERAAKAAAPVEAAVEADTEAAPVLDAEPVYEAAAPAEEEEAPVIDVEEEAE